MFGPGSLKRILITTVISQIAFYIGWYGVGSVWYLVAALVGTVALAVGGMHLINRWHAAGYRRLSERVKIDRVVGARADNAATSRSDKISADRRKPSAS